MNALIIEEDESITPSVTLDNRLGVFRIEGWSHPEDAILFYTPILNWLLLYSKNPNSKTEFHFYFQYFNTASAKQIFNVCTLLDKISKKSKVVIYWHYDKEDIDMRTSGEGFSKMLHVPFEFIEKMQAIL